jgi:hypothetical protein
VSKADGRAVVPRLADVLEQLDRADAEAGDAFAGMAMSS